jgi:hypothetical protein
MRGELTVSDNTTQVMRASMHSSQAVALVQRDGGVGGILGEVEAAVTDVDQPIHSSATTYSDGLTGARLDRQSTVSRARVVPDKGGKVLSKMGVPLDSWPFESTQKKAHKSRRSVTIEDALHFFDDAPHANPLLSARQRAKLMRQQEMRRR